MKAVLLVAGKGTRMGFLTENRAKHLLKVANRPILEHNLEQLNGLVDEVILIVGHNRKQIEDYFGNSFGKIKIRYVVQEQQLGTGHALKLAEKFINSRFIFMFADDLYSKEDIKKALKHELCIIGKEVEDPSRFGVFVLKENCVDRIVEKPKNFVSNLANIGVYILNERIFGELNDLKESRRGELELTAALSSLAKKEKIYCEKVSDYWIPIGYPWDLLKANEFLLSIIRKDIKGKVEEKAVLKGEVVVGKNTVIKSGAYIEGPVIIGENCNIGPNCFIRAYTTIGDNCKIGNSVEIKNSIVDNNTNICHLSYVGDSIIGEKVNLGAGTVIANLRHDNENVKTIIKGKLVCTKTRKFGSVIGDGVHTGINTSIYPGRKIWPNKTTLPGEVVKEDVV